MAKTRRGFIGGMAALVAGVRAAGLAGQASATVAPCPIPGQTLNRKGECHCPPGENDVCPGVGCVSTRSDPNNCGDCGNVCDFGEVCRKGECRCPSGQTCGFCLGQYCPCETSGDCGEGFFCNGGYCSPSDPIGMVFDAPAAAVWRALTDAETLSSLGISSDIAPVVGRRFRFLPAAGSATAIPIEAEMVEVEEPRRFAFTWLNGPLDEPTMVTVSLDSVGDGAATRFRLTHTDPSGASCMAGARVLGRHWGQRFFKDALPGYLAQKR
jgi:uncharacterized protein YndB with AHSA1/START domain